MDQVSGPRTVGVFTMGGTIASMPPSAEDPGVVPRLTAGDLVGSVPGLAATGISLELHDVRRLPSPSLQFGDVQALLDVVNSRFEGKSIDGPAIPGVSVSGAVVTQGTDTIEEAGWLLDLLYEGRAPIVVTGAMRSPGMAGPDGPANLLAAVQVAASPVAAGLGVLVVLNDEIHPARTVRKTHSTGTGAFGSPDAGPIGRVSQDAVTIWHRPARTTLAGLLREPAATTTGGRRRRGRAAARVQVPRIAVLPMTLGQDEVTVRAVGELVEGLVIAGFGAGNVPSGMVGVLTELAVRMPVVLATRTAAGAVNSTNYGYPGSGSDLLGRGLISAGYLDPYKARILLTVLLTRRCGPAQIGQAFAHFGAAPVSAEPHEDAES